MGKTALMMEYLTLYLAVFGELPNFGDVTGVIYVSDSMENGVKGARKSIEFRYETSEFLQHWIPEAKFTDNYLEFKNRDGHRLGVKMFGAATGLKGTKIFAKRPTIALLDDLVKGDSEARSATIMDSIKDTVYKGVNHALDPTRRKVIFSGTPYNSSDILIEAVESGAWDVNVYPVCEKFPCSEAEFKGAWIERFSYEFVAQQYDMALKTGKLNGFYQELMLRITSDEDRLVQDSDIRWYERENLMKNKGNFNFYITTDFAVSEKQTADYSVISVWAYSGNGDWFWVDGICVRQTIDKTIDDLFRLAQRYKPQQVGIETSGQQGAFIKWIQNEMISRNVWFNFASGDKSGVPGIRPTADKLARFNVVVPLFKMGKMYFPQELKEEGIMLKFMGQLRLATFSGLKGKDDCIDTISMLGYLNPWKPSNVVAPIYKGKSIWDTSLNDSSSVGRINSYIV
jgi:predicted phage terminase large subunit-like protein